MKVSRPVNICVVPRLNTSVDNGFKFIAGDKGIPCRYQINIAALGKGKAPVIWLVSLLIESI